MVDKASKHGPRGANSAPLLPEAIASGCLIGRPVLGELEDPK